MIQLFFQTVGVFALTYFTLDLITSLVGYFTTKNAVKKLHEYISEEYFMDDDDTTPIEVDKKEVPLPDDTQDEKNNS